MSIGGNDVESVIMRLRASDAAFRLLPVTAQRDANRRARLIDPEAGVVRTPLLVHLLVALFTVIFCVLGLGAGIEWLSRS